MTRERGPAWDPSRPMREQEGWAEHAAFMHALEDEDFVVLGGPLGDGAKILLVIHANSEEDIRNRLEGDPWASMGLLSITTIERWEILLGDPLRE